jgi:hypothetical protein
MLQAGRSRVWFPMRSLDFSNWPKPSSRTMALGLTQPLTEMSTRNLPGSEGSAGRPDNLTPSVSLVSRRCGSLDVLKPYGPSRPVTGIASPLPIYDLWKWTVSSYGVTMISQRQISATKHALEENRSKLFIYAYLKKYNLFVTFITTDIRNISWKKLMEKSLRP